MKKSEAQRRPWALFAPAGPGVRNNTEGCSHFHHQNQIACPSDFGIGELSAAAQLDFRDSDRGHTTMICPKPGRDQSGRAYDLIAMVGAASGTFERRTIQWSQAGAGMNAEKEADPSPKCQLSIWSDNAQLSLLRCCPLPACAEIPSSSSFHFSLAPSLPLSRLLPRQKQTSGCAQDNVDSRLGLHNI